MSIDDIFFEEVKKNSQKKYIKTLKSEIKKEVNYKANKIYEKCVSYIKKELQQGKLVNKKLELYKTDKDKLTSFLADDLERVYNKQWTKLKDVHKIKKIKECIRSLDIKKKKKSKLITKLVDMLKNKELKTKDVKYKNSAIVKIYNVGLDKYFPEDSETESEKESDVEVEEPIKKKTRHGKKKNSDTDED